MTRMTSHQNFSDDILVSNAIKDGGWRMFVDGSAYLSLNDVINTIVESYDLEDAIDNMFELSCVTYIGNTGNTKEEMWRIW